MDVDAAEMNGESVRVVVVGIGAVTPYGVGTSRLWDGVSGGRVAIRRVEGMPMNGYRSQIAGEVPEVVLPEHDYRRPDGHREPAIDFALKAAEEALESAGIDRSTFPSERWGVVMGTCFGGIRSAEKWKAERAAGGNLAPELLLLALPHALAEIVSAAFGIKGPVVTVDTACASGANAIGYASDLVRSRQADLVLAGGADALCDLNFAGFSSVGALSPNPSAPFSRSRRGLNLGEGSGILVLTSEAMARRLGAPILAEVSGHGMSADGYHPTAPDPRGDGAARAISEALLMAGIDPDEVGYINSHGTGTAKNDLAETRAIRRAFGDAADRLAVSSTKSMIGHLTGAAGAVEAIVTIQALQAQVAPPTANFVEPDPMCDLDYVPNTARAHAMNFAISNNFGFGGANACVVFARAGARLPTPPAVLSDRVVITGIATIVPPGLDIHDGWRAFMEGWDVLQVENGVRLGRVLMDSKPFLSRRQLFRMDAFSLFAVVAAQTALMDAQLTVTEARGKRVGTVFGTGIGPMQSIEEFLRALWDEGPEAVNPTLFPNVVFNGAAGYVAQHLGAVGPTSTVTAGHAAGASALCHSYDLVASNRCDAALCIGVDVLTNTVIHAYQDVGLLRPGDTNFALSEAGVALVLERLSHARARNARIYGQIVGYGITSDASGPGRFDRQGRGQERAMRLALKRAGDVEPSEVWVNAAGYRPADRAEMAAIFRLFPQSMRLFNLKHVFGEPMGVGGLLNAAFALKKFEVTANSLSPDYTALVNSSSMGGTHFAIALRTAP